MGLVELHRVLPLFLLPLPSWDTPSEQPRAWPQPWMAEELFCVPWFFLWEEAIWLPDLSSFTLA